jgi:hypothetical protein
MQFPKVSAVDPPFFWLEGINKQSQEQCFPTTSFWSTSGRTTTHCSQQWQWRFLVRFQLYFLRI